MIAFSTEFPVNKEKSIKDALLLACNWISESPHTEILGFESILDLINKIKEENIVNGSIENDTESVCFYFARVDEFEIGGIRWSRGEKNSSLGWITSVVFKKTQEDHLFSIQVLCEADSTAIKLPIPRKPYIIRQVLENLGGGFDGYTNVSDKPYIFNKSEVEFAANLILGKSQNKLPIIYISVKYDGTYIIDYTKLAKRISGLAHVVVEPNRSFSIFLREKSISHNAYGGNIGIYWPESCAKKSYFINKEQNTNTLIEKNIINDIRIAITNRRQKNNWPYLLEVFNECNYKKIRENNSKEFDDFMSSFDLNDNLIKENKKQIKELEQENDRLAMELRKNNLKGQGMEPRLLFLGVEQNLYQDEIRDIIIKTLKKSISTLKPNSRFSHVILDLIKNNETNAANNHEEKIKEIFDSYGKMDRKTEASLRKLGFSISEDGKHYKLVFQGDSRYTFSIAKTSSDHRAGKNIASDINKQLFKP